MTEETTTRWILYRHDENPTYEYEVEHDDLAAVVYSRPEGPCVRVKTIRSHFVGVEEDGARHVPAYTFMPYGFLDLYTPVDSVED
jgi:hypothetical protein